MAEQKRWTRRPENSTWGDYGADDQLGRMNELTPAKVKEGIAEVKEGKTFCLSMPLDYPGGNVLNPRRHPPQIRPSLRGDKPNWHFRTEWDKPGMTDVINDDVVIMHLQYSTQWDTLAHVGALFDASGTGQAAPTFYNGYLAGLGTNLFALVPQIRAAGIRSISGRLYADDTIFDRRRGVADSGYATSSYIGPLSGLAFNSGFSGATSSSGFSSDPAKLAASKLARALSAGGVAVPPQIALAKTPADAEQVAVVRSPTLTRIVDTTDVYSVNFFAEMLMKLLGARFGSAGTTAAGAAVVEEFARAHGSGVQAVDGSGLTRSNRASPRQVVDLLLAMRDDPAGDEFIQDLALTGQEGTVDDRTRGTPAYRRCRTKTGTITGVSTLSGYCFNKSGRIMAFSILMNGVGDTGYAHLQQDRIAGLIAGY